MFDVIRKADFFRWYEDGYVDKAEHQLKGVQDAWVLSELAPHRGQKLAEVGGGKSRVLERLKADNECWNIDKLEGRGGGPTGVAPSEDVRWIDAYLGDFDERLPDGYFDAVFSISVVEHVADDALGPFFRDCARILKPGGLMLHAIDIYVFDEPRDLARVALYRKAAEQHAPDLAWLETPAIDETLHFSCAYASNSDLQMAYWNRLAPSLRETREVAQCVSIQAGWRKV